MMEENQEKNSVKSSLSPKRKWKRRLIVFLIFIILSPLLLSLILHIPIVQNWAVDKVTSSLSDKLEHNVNVDFIDFSIFDGLALEGFSVNTIEGDTVLNTASLNVSLAKNLLYLAQGELAVHSVELDNLDLNIVRELPNSKTNIELLLAKLAPKKRTNSSSSGGDPLKIILDDIEVSDLSINFIDKPDQKSFGLRAKEFDINVRDVQLDSSIFKINSLNIDGLVITADKQVFELNSLDSTINIITPSKTIIKKAKKLYPHIEVDQLNLSNSSISVNLTNTIKPHFDQNKFSLEDINMGISNFILDTAMQIFVDINQVALKDDKGFEIKSLESIGSKYTLKAIKLPSLSLETGRSHLSTNLNLSYRNRSALKDIMKKTLLKATINDARISLKDVSHFVPQLSTSKFIRDNQNKAVSVDGSFSGRIANLKGNNVKLTLPGVLIASGNFGTRNLDKKNPLINLRMQSLETSIPQLQKILPNFKPPRNFEKLGAINFQGNFDGYPNDFVAYGTINSKLGIVKTDMRLDLKNGSENASYSGDLDLINFDLKEWSGNEDFGKVSFDGKVRNGRGLTLNNVYADLEGSLRSFDFKDYVYKNININGAIDKNTFDGKILSSDLNFNFGFDGFAAYIDNEINFDFKADVGIIDVQAINMSKDKLAFRGEFDFQGKGSTIDDLIGEIDVRNLSITKGDTTIQFDSIIVESYMEDLDKILAINSDESSVYMKGKYQFKTIGDDFQSIIKRNYPFHTRTWNYTPKTITDRQRVLFDITLKKNKPLFELLGLPIDFKAEKFFAKGFIDSQKEEINLITTIPEINLAQNVFKNVFLSLNSMGNNGEIGFRVDQSNVAGTSLNAINLDASVKGDSISFLLNSDKIVDSLQKFEIAGTLFPFNNGYSLTIDDNDIRIYGRKWKINADNLISLDKEYLDINNLSFTDGNRLIQIYDIGNKGIRLNVNKFDMGLINPLVKDDRILFGGDAYANVRVNDVFQKSPDIYGNVLMTNLTINGDSYGELNLDISKPINKPMDAILSFNNDVNGQAIKLVAAIDLDQKRVDADLKAKNVPLKILEYLLAKGIQNVKGSADIAGYIGGPFNDIKIDTKGKTNNGKVRVIVLGETYSFDNQDFKITESSIDLNGAVLIDSEGGKGFITGGLQHKLFKDFFLNASIKGENVIALNTSKFDNPTYYGLGKGDVQVEFTGDVNYPNIEVTAETRKGTTISIPIQSTLNASDKSFITFIDKETHFSSSDTQQKVIKIDGVSLIMNLVMTPEAEVFLIFDENKGDIIEATGNGNMQINMNRNGDFDIFGEYEIRQGNYLFTALGFINKPFVVREGGKVRWNGDPVNARINIKADYQVRTDLSLFLAEYIVTPALEQAASNRTDVNLQMIIGNTLYNPSINFGLDFPDLTGDLQSYADSKVRLLGNNQNDLNNQVFGLIVFNTFLPSNTLSQVLVSGSVIQSASVNTVSEFVSNQLSSYVTRFLNETLEENGLISGIDFDINLRNNLNLQGVNTNTFSIVPTEIEVKLKNRFRFLDGRLSFDLGGNFVRESLIGLNNYVVPEFTFRYALTPDRKLNLKVYGKYDLDEISVTSRRQRLGVGLRYRTEFGSMLETKNIIKKSIVKVNEQ